MPLVKLKIDVAATVGDEAWREIKQFDQIQSAKFGPQFGSGGLPTSHVATAPSAAPPSEAESVPEGRLDWRRNQVANSAPGPIRRFALSRTRPRPRRRRRRVVSRF